MEASITGSSSDSESSSSAMEGNEEQVGGEGNDGFDVWIQGHEKEMALGEASNDGESGEESEVDDAFDSVAESEGSVVSGVDNWDPRSE